MTNNYLIPQMTWSYSRLKTFEDCRYRFYCKYLANAPPEEREMFFSQYGKLMHEIFARFYNGKITTAQALTEYLVGFGAVAELDAPRGIRQRYYENGRDYLKGVVLPDEKILAVEQRVDFKIEDYPFIGYIDLLLGSGESYSIVDHKTRILRRKNSAKAGKYNAQFDEYAVQLYLYSIATEQLYGAPPSEICLNCFRSGEVLTEKFSREKQEQAKQWALDTIHSIERTEEWKPCADYFKCRYICDIADCEYREERR